MISVVYSVIITILVLTDKFGRKKNIIFILIRFDKQNLFVTFAYPHKQHSHKSNDLSSVNVTIYYLYM